MPIRPYEPADTDAVVAFALRAWAPVFASLEHDVLAEQHVWLAEHQGRPVGFASVVLHEKDSTGEVYMLAVDPGHQRGALFDPSRPCSSTRSSDRFT